MPERSPEIEQLTRETVEAMVCSDLDFIEQHTSRDPSVLAIGSDASEWAEGFDEIMRLFRASTPEGETGVRAGLQEVKAFREGEVGWFAARGWFDIAGDRVPIRLTGVVHREDGDWKAVQNHASIGVPNAQMLDPMFRPGA